MKKKGLIGIISALVVLCGIGAGIIIYQYYTINSKMNAMISDICSEGFISKQEIDIHMNAMEDLSNNIFINTDNKNAYHILWNVYEQSMSVSRSIAAFNTGKFRTAYVEMREEYVLLLDPAIKNVKKSDTYMINGNNISYGYNKLHENLDSGTSDDMLANVITTTYWIENSKASIDLAKEYDQDEIIWSGMGYPYPHLTCGMITPVIDRGSSWLEVICTNGDLAFTSNISGGYNMMTNDIHKKYGLNDSICSSFINFIEDVINIALDRYGCVNIENYYLEYGDTLESSGLYDYCYNEIKEFCDKSLNNFAFGYLKTNGTTNVDFGFIDSVTVTKDSYTNYSDDEYDIDAHAISYKGVPIYADYDRMINKLN